MNVKMYIKDYDTFKYVEQTCERFNVCYEFFGIYNEDKKRTATCTILKDIKNVAISNDNIKINFNDISIYIKISNVDGLIISK